MVGLEELTEETLPPAMFFSLAFSGAGELGSMEWLLLELVEWETLPLVAISMP